MQQIFSEFEAVFLAFRNKVNNENGLCPLSAKSGNHNSPPSQFSALEHATQVIMNAHNSNHINLVKPSKQINSDITSTMNHTSKAKSSFITENREPTESVSAAVEDGEDAYSESSFISESKELESDHN